MKAGPSVLPSPFTVWRHLRFWVTGCSCCHRFLGVRGPFAMRWCVPGFCCSVACVVDTQRSPEIKGTFAVVVGFVMASSQIPNWLRELLTIRSRDWSFSFVFHCKWFRSCSDEWPVTGKQLWQQYVEIRSPQCCSRSTGGVSVAFLVLLLGSQTSFLLTQYYTAVHPIFHSFARFFTGKGRKRVPRKESSAR